MFLQNNFHPLNECLACGSDKLEPVLDLGKQPLANSYKKTKDENQVEFPLAINRCHECCHVQLTVAVKPELMFKDYAYVSGTSKTMHDHMQWFAKWSCEYFDFAHNDKATSVLDIGCNDGTQLDYYLRDEIKTFGVDPAENLYPVSSAKGHTIFPTFFDMKFVEQNDLQPDIIVAQNVFAHNYDPYGFMQAVRNVMTYRSLFFIQTSQADMIKNNEFDTIYHEHISFYNIKSMKALCDRTGFYLIDVVKAPIHGNSYIFVVSKDEGLARPEHIENLIAMESFLYSAQTYKDYEEHVLKNVRALQLQVDNFKRTGYKIIGYGAAAKGMTLLNFAKLDLDFIIDDNKLKQNKFTPGMSIPILPATELDKLDSSDRVVFIPLAWNFFDEIKANIKRRRNGNKDHFMKYFPEVKVIQ